jgi:cytochrome c biogenesis protein CcmG/thiol:disulfide interchange protein DsbE
MPELTATTLDGRAVSLQSLAGEVALVNVWATWCEPCRHELPVLAKLQRDQPGLRVVAISVDRTRSAAELRTFTERRALPFAIWHDPDDRASAALGIGTLPASFLVGRDGLVKWRRAGVVRPGDEELFRALAASL